MINWRVRTGYGFKLDVKGAMEAAGGYDETLDDIESRVAREFPLLDIEYAGSMYDKSGYEQWVFIKNSITKLDEWALTIDPQKMLDSITAEDMEQLFEFVAETGCAIDEPQWRMLLCKS